MRFVAESCYVTGFAVNAVTIASPKMRSRKSITGVMITPKISIHLAVFRFWSRAAT